MNCEHMNGADETNVRSVNCDLMKALYSAKAVSLSGNNEAAAIQQSHNKLEFRNSGPISFQLVIDSLIN